MTVLVLKKKISKNPEVRRSKWHVQPLSDAQKIYAATDAYVSLLIYRELENHVCTFDDLTEGEKKMQQECKQNEEI